MFDLNIGKVTVTSVANAGVLINTKKKKILVDGLHKGKNHTYSPVDDTTAEKIIKAKDIFSGLDLLLITHDHSDHFSPELCFSALSENKALHIVGTDAVAKALKDMANGDEDILSRIWSIEPDPNKSLRMNIRGINIEACDFIHDTYESASSKNVAYLFTLNGKTFLHIGDAKADVEAFEKMECLKRKIDVMFVPFPYVGTTDGRKVISTISPQKLVVMHLPEAEIDTNRWADKAKIAYDKNASALPPATFFEKPGQSFTV